MSWTKLTDTFAEEMDRREISPAAFTLHVAALCYCSRLLTNGAIKRRHVAGLYSLVDDPAAAAKELVEAGLWQETDAGYVIVDYLKDQRSRVQVLEERQKAAVRQANWRATKSGNSKQSSNGVTNSVSNAPQPRPAPKEGAGGPSGSPDGSPLDPSAEFEFTNHQLMINDLVYELEVSQAVEDNDDQEPVDGMVSVFVAGDEAEALPVIRAAAASLPAELVTRLYADDDEQAPAFGLTVPVAEAELWARRAQEAVEAAAAGLES